MRTSIVNRGLTPLVLAGLVSACHHRVAPMTAESCQPAPPQGAPNMNLEQLPGTYAVIFVATGGPQTGQTVTGRMVLRPQDPAMVAIGHPDTSVMVSQPTIGQLDLALEDVGATRMGDPMAANDTMPGVGFYVTRLRNGDVTGVVARVGSGSNARGMMLFDGGYFALYVRNIATDRIDGGWASAPGGIVGQEARGHFCAIRIAAGN